MKGGSVLNSARNCAKARCASIEPSAERDREKYGKRSRSATRPPDVSSSYTVKPKALTHSKWT